jgi:hypothetical protein
MPPPQKEKPPSAPQPQHLRDVAESLDNENIDAVFDGLLMQPANPL